MLDVMIITFNEAMNLPRCLEALQGWTRRIFVIDSGSTDGTPDMARAAGATVVHHDWEGYARQKNWGLATLPFEGDWVLILDADEVITPTLRAKLEEVTARDPATVPENGFFINRLTYFMGGAIRHCGYFPSWNMRLLKRGKGHYENREVHEHIIIDDPVGYIREPMIHDDQRGLEHYLAKHNRYSTLEARALLEEMHRPKAMQPNLTPDARRRRWLKQAGMKHVPMPGMWRFVYMYFLRLGILDGRPGLEFCRLISMYDAMVSIKFRTLRRHENAQQRESIIGHVQGLSRPEGLDNGHGPGDIQAAPAQVVASPYKNPRTLAATTVVGGGEPTTEPEPSPWSFKEKLARAAWMVLGKPLFRASFHNWYGYRAWLLRRFGAKVGKHVAIRPTVNVEIPWMLDIEEEVAIGDFAIVYSLGPVHIGKRAIISQYAHVCAGTHAYNDRRFTLIRAPITIGDDVWIGADAFIGPKVNIGQLAVVGARSSVYGDLPARMVCVGNPARPIKQRVLQ